MTTLIPKFEQTGSTVNRPINLKFQETISVTDFGASPSNTAAQNDVAFHAASRAIMANGGGTLLIPPGEYKVCQQKQNYTATFGPDTGSGPYAWYAEPAISINGCTSGVNIQGYGATLVMPDGQYFGSFTPGTTTPYTPTLPFWNIAYAAMPGFFIALYNNNGPVNVEGLELNGNNTKYVVGGQWGDTGYQVAADGIYVINNFLTTIKNCVTSYCGRDGIDLLRASVSFASESNPVRIENVISEYNVRQGLSIQGGIDFVIDNCSFSNTGQAINVGTTARLYSAPGSGIDIEPQTGTIVSDIAVNNCAMNNNYGIGFQTNTSAALGGNIAVNNCEIWQTHSYSISIDMGNVVFNNSRIYGTFRTVKSDASGLTATQFNSCSFGDPLYPPTGTISGQGTTTPGVVGIGNAPGVRFTNCAFSATYQPMGSMNDCIIENCSFQQNASTLPDKSWVLDISGATMINNRITDNNFSPTANGYYVKLNFSQTFIGNNYINNLVPNTPLKWVTWDAADGGYGGYYGSTSGDWTAQYFLGINKGLGINSYNGYIRMFAFTAAPITGTWKVGDRVYNQTPVVGQPKSWVCTVAGTPGTWVSEGNL